MKKENILHSFWAVFLIIMFLLIFTPEPGKTDINSPNFPGISRLGEPWSDKTDEKYELLFPQAGYSFDYGDPTAAEQAHLEAINRARLDPAGEAALLGIDLFEGVAQGEISGLPVQPLVLNSNLSKAALAHSQDMIDQDYFAHNSLNGKTPFERMEDKGYQYSFAGENLALIGSTGPIDEVTTVLDMHDNLFIDKDYPGRGHRVNLLSKDFKEAGLGVALGDYQGYSYTYMLTCDFGTALQFSGSFILGVVYDDKDADNFYDAGEGISNVSIQLVNTADSTVTASAGGYGIPVFAGDYTVKALLSDGTSAQKQITVGGENKKIDFKKSDFGSASSGTTQVGNSPGSQTINVSASQMLSLVVNVTNSAGAAPVYQWIWAKTVINSSNSPVYILTQSGWQMFTSYASLESMAYDPGSNSEISLGNFSMSQLGLSSGDSLIYGYAYTAGTVADLIVENSVTLKVQ